MDSTFTAKHGAAGTPTSVTSLTCPSCKQIGSFQGIVPDVRDVVVRSEHKGKSNQVISNIQIGIRTCPNTQCRAIVYIAQLLGTQLPIDTYPKTRIEFDITNVPKQVVESFQEALICTSEECFVAAAIMIRRTLEDLCADKKVSGNNLKNRLEMLASQMILPKELLEAANDLRLLGNDAAHIQAKTFNEIGPEEVLIAIDLTKELIKALYQYQTLLDRLRSRQKTT